MNGGIGYPKRPKEIPMAQDPTYTPEPDAAELKKLGGYLAAIGHSIEQELEHPSALAAELMQLYPKVMDALTRRVSNEYMAKE